MAEKRPCDVRLCLLPDQLTHAFLILVIIVHEAACAVCAVRHALYALPCRCLSQPFLLLGLPMGGMWPPCKAAPTPHKCLPYQHSPRYACPRCLSAD